MFSKILIANRGEIACRVIKTAKAMGIKTAVVFSEADADALHVEMADEGVFIGPPPATESYLVIDKIIDAVKKTGAEAVHPGYGFLSENVTFAEALAAENIAFIGPNVEAIRVMGDKIASKKFANEAEVSTVPGYLGIIDTPERAIEIANDIGYPVMIKASAGGGGKGMRIAQSADEVKEGFISSVNEAKSAFGDDRIFVEKFVTNPRHIEIQVMADKHGNTLYVGERECSVQRRNQKVIEEAPSPFVDPAMRKAMGEQAVALAKAVKYESAGTVEFIVDQDKNFYFLEMNTRLQVEHPVTELVTGIDLVEQMIKVAAGEKLALTQDDIKLNGWAFESRIYAEDPYREFLPSIGRLKRYAPPAESKEKDLVVRNDTGVVEGSEISLFYDPMIAKLCTWAPTREASMDAMLNALDGFLIEGIEHNIPFLAALYGQERFRSGALTTNYIKEEFPDGFQGIEPDAALKQRLALVGCFAQLKHEHRMSGISGVLLDQQDPVREDWVVQIGDWSSPVRIEHSGSMAEIFLGDETQGGTSHRVMSAWVPGERVFVGSVDGASAVVQIKRVMGGYEVAHRGVSTKVSVHPPKVADLVKLMPEKPEPDTSKMLLCPMPGLV
ncbi:MAG: acetyl/propionyl/methylcrotonyl-CoA carboxylase subunit alpha, partial [Pseudomonadota bacterium]